MSTACDGYQLMLYVVLLQLLRHLNRLGIRYICVLVAMEQQGGRVPSGYVALGAIRVKALGLCPGRNLRPPLATARAGGNTGRSGTGFLAHFPKSSVRLQRCTLPTWARRAAPNSGDRACCTIRRQYLRSRRMRQSSGRGIKQKPDINVRYPPAEWPTTAMRFGSR